MWLSVLVRTAEPSAACATARGPAGHAQGAACPILDSPVLPVHSYSTYWDGVIRDRGWGGGEPETHPDCHCHRRHHVVAVESSDSHLRLLNPDKIKVTREKYRLKDTKSHFLSEHGW